MNAWLYNPKNQTFETTVLENMANTNSIDIALSEEEIASETPPFASPLKRLIWFYKKYPKSVKTKEAQEHWAVITSGLDGVEYQKGANPNNGQKNVCEISAGLGNMLRVIAELLQEPSLKFQDNADPYKENERILTHLCAIISSEDNKWSWSFEQERKEAGVLKIIFKMNQLAIFLWKFMSFHFDLKYKNYYDNHWQLTVIDLKKDEFNLVSQRLKSLINFYKKYDPQKIRDPKQTSVWNRLYANLKTENTCKGAIEFFSNPQYAEYSGLALHWMKSLPLEDIRIKVFVTESLIKNLAAQKKEPNFFSKHLTELKALQGKDLDDLKETIAVEDAIELFKGYFEEFIYDEKFINDVLQLGGPELNSFLYSECLKKGIVSIPLINKSIIKEDTEAIHKILELKPDLNKKIENTPTPLKLASTCLDIEIVKLLLRSGATPNLTFSDENPLADLLENYLLNEKTALKIMDLLLEYGADPNLEIERSAAQFYYLISIIRLTLSKKHYKPAILFLENGANLTPVKNRNPNLIKSVPNGQTLLDHLRYPEDFSAPLDYLEWATDHFKDPTTWPADFPMKAIAFWLIKTLNEDTSFSLEPSEMKPVVADAITLIAQISKSDLAWLNRYILNPKRMPVTERTHKLYALILEAQK